MGAWNSMLKQLKYYDNKPEKGLIVDYGFIQKEYRKLKVPKKFAEPCISNMLDYKYIIEMSERSRGKTTCWLLVGLLLNWYYGIITQYIRQTDEMLKKAIIGDLFDVINTYKDGYYVNKITGGRWNHVTYKFQNKAFYFCNVEDGTITEIAEEECVKCLSVENRANYKSGYNAPFGDFILYDEFVGKRFSYNEPVEFFDLLSTIIRRRISPVVVMLANNLNVNNPYFEEMEILKIAKKMVQGEKKLITTDLGTKIAIRLLNNTSDAPDIKIHNSLFFGFKDERLSSITGTAAWVTEKVQHIPKKKDYPYDVYDCNTFIEIAEDEFLQLEFVTREDAGLCLYVHYADIEPGVSQILTLNEDKIGVKHYNKCDYYFGLSTTKFKGLLQRLYNKKKIFYSSNEVGSDFLNYIKQCSSMR